MTHETAVEKLAEIIGGEINFVYCSGIQRAAKSILAAIQADPAAFGVKPESQFTPAELGQIIVADKRIAELEAERDRLIDNVFKGRSMKPTKDRIDIAMHRVDEIRASDGAYKSLYEEVKDKLDEADKRIAELEAALVYAIKEAEDWEMACAVAIRTLKGGDV